MNEIAAYRQHTLKWLAVLQSFTSDNKSDTSGKKKKKRKFEQVKFIWMELIQKDRRYCPPYPNHKFTSPTFEE